MAQAGTTRADLGVGMGVAAAIHVLLGIAIMIAPAGTGHTEVVTAQEAGCSSVVSPSCVGAEQRKPAAQTAEEKEESKPLDERRCPEPLRRGLRREHEPPPSVAVDLLQAELVAALGSESGKAAQAAGQPLPVPKITDGLFGDTKLGSILNENADAQAKKKKLGDILGTATGKVGGEGKVNMPGSAYVREVRQSVQDRFVLPPSVPVWERAGLVAKIRITRMTASGQVLEYSIEKKSGHEGFDDAVADLMRGYKSGMRTLPEPPPHILEEINSRGMMIELRGAAPQ
jgi:hypothetical protein